MSENTNTSNAKIIDELTKDLASECVLKSEESSKNANPCDNLPEAKDVFYDANKDFDHDEKEIDDTSDCEYLDEVALKDEELELSDDQLAENKIIAEELKSVGNQAFKEGEFETSIDKYTEGLRICPLRHPEVRAMLHCNRAAASMKLEKHEKAIEDCSKAIEFDERYVKAYLRRAQCYEVKEKLDESLADFQKILELEPSHREARAALTRLPPKIEERNEKLKTEMIGKLKDLGNMFLKPFGLSTANFNLQQDAEGKGYSVNFKQ